MAAPTEHPFYLPGPCRPVDAYLQDRTRARTARRCQRAPARMTARIDQGKSSRVPTTRVETLSICSRLRRDACASPAPESSTSIPTRRHCRPGSPPGGPISLGPERRGRFRPREGLAGIRDNCCNFLDAVGGFGYDTSCRWAVLDFRRRARPFSPNPKFSTAKGTQRWRWVPGTPWPK